MARNNDQPTVLVVDYGAQYAQLIARRVREAKIYSEIVPSSMPVSEMMAKNPSAIVLSGGPASIYSEGAPQTDPELLKTGIPTFGICYGFQAMTQALGGKVDHTGKSEFGKTTLNVSSLGNLLSDEPRQQNVWMSHGDSVTIAPEGFTVLASTAQTTIAAFEHTTLPLAGVQFHPEVLQAMTQFRVT